MKQKQFIFSKCEGMFAGHEVPATLTHHLPIPAKDEVNRLFLCTLHDSTWPDSIRESPTGTDWFYFIVRNQRTDANTGEFTRGLHRQYVLRHQIKCNSLAEHTSNTNYTVQFNKHVFLQDM